MDPVTGAFILSNLIKIGADLWAANKQEKQTDQLNTKSEAQYKEEFAYKKEQDALTRKENAFTRKANSYSNLVNDLEGKVNSDAQLKSNLVSLWAGGRR